MRITVSVVTLSLITVLSSVQARVTRESQGRDVSANDFLIKKWKTWYNFLDVDTNGVLSETDVEITKTRYSMLLTLEADEEKLAMDKYEKWWNDYIFRGENGTISEKQFVDNLHNEFKAGEANFRSNMQRCFDEIFALIDTDQDGTISETEFTIVDGSVPITDMVTAWVEFATCPDSCESNIIVEKLGPIG